MIALLPNQCSYGGPRQAKWGNVNTNMTPTGCSASAARPKNDRSFSCQLYLVTFLRRQLHISTWSVCVFSLGLKRFLYFLQLTQFFLLVSQQSQLLRDAFYHFELFITQLNLKPKLLSKIFTS